MRYNLISRRKKNKYTQQEMATMLNIARTTYCAYENGTIDPPLDKAVRIKEILNYKNDNIFLNENVRRTD